MSIASASQPRAVKAKLDAVLAGAVNIAREAAVLDAEHASHVGEHLGMTMVGERLAAHTFACEMRGYVGWQWTVTVARVPRGRVATICEVHLLPTQEAILAPQWLPWAQRLQPGDIGPGDVLPFKMDDPRLVDGYVATGNLEEDQVAIEELALARTRILSETGRDDAAKRWFEGDNGPRSAGSLQSAGSCGGCGFLVPLQGALGQVFGVCANMWSNDDGKVVALGHGCGAHSETDVPHRASEWPDNNPIIDDTAIESVTPEELAALPAPSPVENTAATPQVEPAKAVSGEQQTANVEAVSTPNAPESSTSETVEAPELKKAKNQRRKSSKQHSKKSSKRNDDAIETAEHKAASGIAQDTAPDNTTDSHKTANLSLELPAVNEANLVKVDREQALHSLDLIAQSLPQRGSKQED